MQSQDKLQSSIGVVQQIICGPYSDEVLFQAFQLLVKILQNIVKNPSEEKYRSIKKTNPALQKKLFTITETEKLLELLGFIHIEEALVFVGDDYTTLDKIATALDSQVKRIQDRNLTSAQKEEIEKQKFLEERRKQVEAELQAKAEAERKLKERMELDKKEQALREKPKDSKANKLEFGSNSKTWKDIGVDLSCQSKK